MLRHPLAAFPLSRAPRPVGDEPGFGSVWLWCLWVNLGGHCLTTLTPPSVRGGEQVQ